MSELERANARYRRALENREAALVASILRDYHAVEANVRPRIEALLEEIADLRASGQDVPVSFLFERDRLQRLENNVIREMEQITGKTYDQIVAEQGHAAGMGSRNAVTLTNLTAGTNTGANALSVRAMDRMLANLYDGSPLLRLVNRLPGDAAQRVRDTLVQSVALGRNPRVTGRMIQDAFDGNATRALTIARTEQMRAYRAAQVETYEQNDEIVERWVWMAAIGSMRTCAMCFAMHGQEFPRDEPMASHPNCIPAGAVVAGPRVVGSTSRWFEGEIVEIHTASGNRLSVTPNHPILTPQGWVAAGFLDVGGDVISNRTPEGGLAGVNPDDQQIPALIENVAESFGGPVGVTARSMPTAAEDFHGDGVGSQVHVVRAKRRLRNHIDSPLLQPFKQQHLCGRHAKLQSLSSLRSLNLFSQAVLSATNSFVGGLDTGLVLFRRLAGGYKDVSLALAASGNIGTFEYAGYDRSGDPQASGYSSLTLPGSISVGDDVAINFDPRAIISEWDAILAQHPVDDLGSDAVFLAKSFSRFARGVHADEIVDIRRVPFAGQVYNLQTTDGWYSANNIVTHNCRCSTSPVVRNLPPSITPGVQRFDDWAEERQLVILGPSKHRAYQDGAITLQDLVGERDSRVWGPSRYERSLVDVLGPRRAAQYYAPGSPIRRAA